VFRATADLARARGATPLVVIPQFGGEEWSEETLRQRIFGDDSVPYLMVGIDEGWRLAWDRHPNAAAARAIATAIAAQLR